MDAKRNTNKNERGRNAREKEKERTERLRWNGSERPTEGNGAICKQRHEKQKKMRIVRNYKYIIIIIIVKRNP